MIELNLYASLSSLTTFRHILELKPVKALQKLMFGLEESNVTIDEYADVFYQLTSEGFDNMTDYFIYHLKFDDTAYGNAVARNQVSNAIEKAAKRDIDILNLVGNLPCQALKGGLQSILPPSWSETVDNLPEWESGGSISFDELNSFYKTNGCGMFAKFKAFVWQNNTLHPVENPDYLDINSMWGYERQRNKIVENTRALVSGKQVNNVLLYGKSGTGKSATVKSMLSIPEFEGLRIIEVPKSEIACIPTLVRNLAKRPQKFIIFIDDLSFTKQDDTFSALKSILEGSLEPRPTNAAVYCTSNRRHLIQQNFSDRTGDEVDINETIQDKTALADRFGLCVLFTELSKFQFIDMICDLAKHENLELSEESIRAEAVKWDIRYPSRSPRNANQFVAHLRAISGKK